MWMKVLKSGFALFFILLLLSVDHHLSALPAPDIAGAASPPAQQNNQNAGPELDAADVVNFFWHPNVNGSRSLNRQSVRHSELGISSNEAKDPKKVALAFVETQRNALGLAATDDIKWTPVRVQSEKNGVAHVTLQQTYKSVPILAGRLIVHMKDNIGITAANGEYPAAIDLATKPKLSVEAAYKVAQRELDLENRMLIEQALLIFNPAILDLGQSANHLAYRLVAGSLNGPEKQVIFIDAHTGKLLFFYDELNEGLNRAIFSLGGSTTLPGTQCYDEAGPISGGQPPADCTSAYNFTGDTYNYFLDTYGRDSFDNNGATMRASVNYGTTANAFWNGFQTAFGPGFATKDVVAHEWGHAVTQYTADLIYSYQSGALNESMSDIFGAMVDREDWLVGEDTPIGALRSMEDPNIFGDPKSVNDPNFYCGSSDNGGVHINSGVSNHAAYLIAEGGNLNGTEVTGVGRNDTEAVFYRALTTYLTSGSNFADAANALTSACSDLFGTGSATCQTVADAIQATQMTAPVCSVTSVPDSYEPDNTFSQASTIDVNGAAQSHTFHVQGDNDWVQFLAVSGTDYVIETSNLGNQNDTVLYLYDTNGTTQIAIDDDGGDGVASRIAWTASTNGTYYIRVRHYSANASGSGTNYDLSVSGTGGTLGEDDFENDDSAAQASVITPNGGVQSHNFHDAGDLDWVQFSATVDSSYLIETLNLNAESDTVLALFDVDGTTLLVSDDDGGDGPASRIEWIAPASGTYFIRVSHFNSNTFGPDTAYDLRVTTDGVAADSYEPDNISTQASDIAVNSETQTHNFHVAGDEDWIQFSATTGSNYVIETSNLGNLNDTIIELYDTDAATLLESDDDGGDALASRIDWTAPANGTYFARIHHYSEAAYGTNTNYDVSVVTTGAGGLADIYEDDDTSGDANNIAVNGEAQTHTFHDTGDEDWVSFQAEVGVNYTLQTFNLGDNSDTVMALYDTDASTLLAFNDDNGSGLASRINWIAPADGTYYLNIYHYSPAIFGENTEYDLEVIGVGSASADSYEVDDDAAAATTININQTQADHNFHDAGDQDWVEFSAVSGETYTLETLNLGSRSDTILELYDTDSTTLLASDDDGGSGLASRIDWTAPANGTYFAKIRHFFPETAGANTDYDVRLTGNVDGVDDYEPDDTVAQAGVISTDGDSQTHNFHQPGDLDWMAFTATGGTSYLIETSNLGPASDTVLELYDTDGITLLAVNDDGGVGLASRINWTAPSSGDYLVKVRHYVAEANGSGTEYDIQVTDTGGNGDNFEPDNSIAQANLIATDGVAQTHNFHFAGDQDWVRFEATGGTTYVIETFNLDVESDTYLYLYNSDEVTILETDDDSGDEPFASRIEWSALANATYYVQVRHYSSGAYGPQTSYDLAISSIGGEGGDEFEPDNSYTLATPIGVNASIQTHNFHFAGDQDWVQFEAIKGVTYFIETLNLAFASDTVLELYDTNGTTALAFDDDSGDGLGSLITWTADDDGLYFVKAAGFADTIFGPNTDYDLQITSDGITGPDDFEPDNSKFEANVIGVDPPSDVQTHNFHTAGDEDWVAFSGIQGETCTIQTLNLGAQSDTYLEFHDSVSLIASDDDGGPGLASRIVIQIPEDESYYVKVAHSSPSASGPSTTYDLTIACTGLGGPDAYEGDNSPDNATIVPTDGTLTTHNFHEAEDVDWIKFEANAGQSYSLVTSDLGPNSDTVMALYDTDGVTLIAVNDDDILNETLASRIEWTAPANGTYFAQIYHFNSDIFGPDTNYNLSVSETFEGRLLTTAARVELTNSAAGVGDEVEAIIYLEEAVSTLKVETLAKAAYFDLIEVVPLDSQGAVLGQQLTNDADRWQLETTPEGGVSATYSGKLDWDGSQTMPALRLRWRLTAPLPTPKISLPFQLTTINYNGHANTQDFDLSLTLIGDDPKIDDVSPKIFTNEADTVLSIQGSNFQATPKVYLVKDNQEIPLIEVEIVDPDPGAPFVQATVPAATKAGVYKVKLINPDQTSAQYASIEITGDNAPVNPDGQFIYLPLITK